jgi:hypothetical protein
MPVLRVCAHAVVEVSMNRVRVLVAVACFGGFTLVGSVSAGIVPCLDVVETASSDGTCGSNTCAVAVENGLASLCYTVANCGNFTATNVSAFDDPLGTIPLPSQLGPGISATALLNSAVVTDTTSLVTVSADFDGEVFTETATARVAVVPQITLQKTVITDDACTSDGVLNGSNVITVTAGTHVTYCYRVANPSAGNVVTYTTHTLFDDVLGTIAIGQPCTLGPGGTCVISATATIGGPTKNTATWTAVTTDTALCGVTQTVTNTAMAMAMVNVPTATPTPGMEGAPCMETTDCEPGLECVDNVCSPNVAPAPAASHGGILIILGLLLLIGALGLLRTRRSV